MKNLENLQLQELTFEEQVNTDGGFDLGLGLALMGAAIYIYNEGGDFIDGFKNGYNSTRKY